MTDTMTESREAEILRQIPTLTCDGQLQGFRKALAERGERLTGPIMVALAKRAEDLQQREKR